MKNIGIEEFGKLINNGLEGKVEFHGKISVHNDSTPPKINILVLYYNGKSNLSRIDNGFYLLRMGENTMFRFKKRENAVIKDDGHYPYSKSLTVPINLLSEKALLIIESPSNIVY